MVGKFVKGYFGVIALTWAAHGVRLALLKPLNDEAEKCEEGEVAMWELTKKDLNVIRNIKESWKVFGLEFMRYCENYSAGKIQCIWK